MSTHSHDPKAIDIIHIWIRATHSIQRDFKTQISSLDMPFHISGPRLHLLSTVLEAGKIRMNELAARLGIQARTVTDLVDALEKENLLVRTPDSTDRRATLIQLTELAHTYLSKALAKQDEIAENLIQNLTMEQRTQLLELLLIMTTDKDLSADCDDECK